MMEAPLEYRMSDWENVGVRGEKNDLQCCFSASMKKKNSLICCCLESQYVQSTTLRLQPPEWPADKQLALRECFHFAACARRIGKLATMEKRSSRSRCNSSDDDEGFELSSMAKSRGFTAGQPSIISAWMALASVDGLTGAPLGFSVKNGLDWTLCWLCCTLVFGGQVLVRNAEARNADNTSTSSLAILPQDFDCRPEGYESTENEIMIHPKPIPEAIATLHKIIDDADPTLRSADHEIKYCLGVLEYIVGRLTSPQAVAAARQSLHFHDNLGCFLELHCGHNNQYSSLERQRFRELLTEALEA